MKVIIPFKSRGAKSRLRAVLNEEEREEFARYMLRDVLKAICAAGIDSATIICTAPTDLALEGLNMEVCIVFDKRGLNDVLNDVLRHEDAPLLIIMADLPLLSARNIKEILSHEEDVVLAPGRKGGTNILFLRKPQQFAVDYYGVSFLDHISTARRRGLSVAIYDSFLVSTDIDEPDDLIELLIHGANKEAANFLKKIGVELDVDKEVRLRRRS